MNSEAKRTSDSVHIYVEINSCRQMITVGIKIIFERISTFVSQHILCQIR